MTFENSIPFILKGVYHKGATPLLLGNFSHAGWNHTCPTPDRMPDNREAASAALRDYLGRASSNSVRTSIQQGIEKPAA